MVKSSVYESLSKEDVELVMSLKRRMDSTIENLISDAKYLCETLTQFKNSLNQCINANLEEADIVSKYRNADTGGAYNLPGVFAGTAGAYNLNDMKADNEKLRDAQTRADTSEDIRTTSYSMISQSYGDIKSKLNLLANDNQQIFNYIEKLKDTNKK